MEIGRGLFLSVAICFGLLSNLTSQALASCTIHDSEGKSISTNQDALARILMGITVCPEDVFQLRQAIKMGGAQLSPSLVANRGFHNPSQGSFSIFEMVTGVLKELHISLSPGDFFFGHFTTIGPGNLLVPEQKPIKGSLMVEAIAADPSKGYYNFYELRGNGLKGEWFYRGDSADIFADIKNLHRRTDSDHPLFGSRLRCSGCHLGGGPLIKEISSPHNDWWTPERRLDFGSHVPDSNLQSIFKDLVSVSRLASDVKTGLMKLEESSRFQILKSSRTLQEQLRPLFCPLEINIASDTEPYEARVPTLTIPLESLIDLHLLPPQERPALTVDRRLYLDILSRFQSTFLENGFPDADHAWLTPVKAFSDSLAISSLLKRGIVDRDFVAAVLAVDMTNPLFSKGRCGLLKFVPLEALGWKASLISNLKMSKIWSAKEFLANLTEPGRNLRFQNRRAVAFIQNCLKRLQTREGLTDLFQVMRQRRVEVKASEISKNPKGQILEPGFRVIFPETTPPATPGLWGLDESCSVKRYLGAGTQVGVQ